MLNSNRHRNVLCVESAQRDEDSLAGILKTQELLFDVADSTDEALALHGERHSVTLIASGVRGFLSAPSLCRQLKAKSAAAAVIFVASPSRPGDWLDMLEAGADFATPRTLPPRVLAAQISALTRRFGPSIAETETSPGESVDGAHTIHAGALTLDLLTGDYCDNTSLQCTTFTGVSPTNCYWTGWISEEGGGLLSFGSGYFARGAQCDGDYCDNKRWYVCQQL